MEIRGDSSSGYSYGLRQSLQQQDATAIGENTPSSAADEAEGASQENSESTQNSSTNTELTPSEEALVDKLEARDREVRTHEAAHMAAGGSLVTGGASFSYQQGPDGKMYAIGGEVSISIGSESDPQATISKMQQVRAAALAPADPSPTDHSVASTAMMLEARARVQLSQEQAEERAQSNAETTDSEQTEESETADGTLSATEPTTETADQSQSDKSQTAQTSSGTESQ